MKTAALIFCIFASFGPRAGGEDSIFGKITDTTSKPVEGATIRIFKDIYKYSNTRLAAGADRARLRTQVGEANSDAEGNFSIPSNAKNIDVEVSAPGFGNLLICDAHPGAPVAATLGRACTATGRVKRDDGSAVENATVTFTYGVKPPQLQRTQVTTDRDGAYKATNLPLGSVELRVTAPVDCRSLGFAILLEEGETKDCNLIVKHGSYISGKVTDAATGKPIEGVELSDNWTFDKKVKTNSEGVYMLEGIRENETSTLYIRAGAYGGMTRAVYDVPERGAVENIKLQKGRVAKGRLVDEEGKPLAGAYVLAGAQFKDYNTTFTDENGNFTITGINRDCHHTLVIRMDGRGAVQYVFPPSESSSEVVDFGSIVLLPGLTVSGVVTDTNGRPVEGVRASLRGMNGDTDKFAQGNEFPDEILTSEWSSLTDSRGRYYFTNLAEGEYTVSAWLMVSCEPTKDETVNLKNGKDVGNCNFTVRRDLPISGIILGPDGKPVTGAYVAILRPEAENDFINYFAYLHCDSTGTFNFWGLAPGNYTIEVDTRSQFAHPLEKSVDGCASNLRITNIPAGSRNVKIQLKKNAPIEGAVVDRDGAPVEGASVFEPEPISKLLPVQTGRDGRFKIDLPEGSEMKLMISPPRPKADAESRPAYIPPTEVDHIPAGKKDLVVKLSNYPP